MVRSPRTGAGRKRTAPVLSPVRLDELIEQATVDAHDESEQAMGFYTMIEDHLALPFETTILGVPVTVERIDVTERDQIVAVCARGRARQKVPIVDLPLPSPPPDGAEWIAAYRRWLGD